MGKTSMQDIADELNISKNAVSLALNGKPGISDALKDKILEKARELNYEGLNKIKLKKKNLLLIVDDRFDREDEFFLPLISSLLRHSAEQGYCMMLTTVSEEMQKKIQFPVFIMKWTRPELCSSDRSRRIIWNIMLRKRFPV